VANDTSASCQSVNQSGRPFPLGGRVKTGHLSTGKTGHLTGDRDQ
jgi:hypothetical protein